MRFGVVTNRQQCDGIKVDILALPGLWTALSKCCSRAVMLSSVATKCVRGVAVQHVSGVHPGMSSWKVHAGHVKHDITCHISTFLLEEEQKDTEIVPLLLSSRYFENGAPSASSCYIYCTTRR